MRSRRINLARLGTLGALVALAPLAVLGAQGAQASPVPAAQSKAEAKPDFKPVQTVPVSLSEADLASQSTRAVSVMVQVSGEPVTVVDADAETPLTSAQESAVRKALVKKQSTVAGAVQANGGKVLGAYQYAYNGLRVSIAANRVAKLAKVPGVIGVHAFTPKTLDNIHGVPLIGAPQVWEGLPDAGGPFAGENIKIGIIDSGLDYTHADFGGPGTPGAYTDAHAAQAAPPDPSLVGPAAPRVKGGVDLVGDAYTGSNAPTPDSNPLDCGGHGTHVAGSAAGSGVLADGSTYTGPYQADTVSSHSFRVGPGVAPKADLYPIRVFGCTGATNVVVDAIEWAVANDMDVINMSLGAAYGGVDDPDVVAANNAARGGVIVVSSAGNNGQNPYLVGSPGTATAGIAVAANDPTETLPGAMLTLSTDPAQPIQAIEANGVSVAGLGTLPVKVLYNSATHDAAHISLGCDPNEYTAAGVTGTVVVVRRGTCARVARAVYGQQAGAAAVVMVNTDGTLPPFEGVISQNPDTGEQYLVTIPFLGVPSTAAGALVTADGGTVSMADNTISQPGALALASFSSGGPRSGDSALKPDVTAPGVAISSAGMGTGAGSVVMSGTSMAAPHTAGMAALVREAHPTWKKVHFWKAAIVNTANADLVSGYSTRVAGAGLIQAPAAVATEVVALGGSKTATLNYGYAQLSSDYAATHNVTLRNFGSAPATFDVGHAEDAGSPHSLTLPPSVTVPAHGTVSMPVGLAVPAATAGDSNAFHDVAGLVTFTPRSSDNNDVTLSVPYYLVPQAVSKITTQVRAGQLSRDHSTTAHVTNPGGVVTGVADWYAWGLSDPKDAGLGAADLRAVGVAASPGFIAFAVSTYNRWSNAAAQDNEIYVDVNDDATDDYLVVAADRARLQGLAANGETAVAVFDLRTGQGTIQYFAEAPLNSSTMVLPVNISQLCRAGSPCLSAANPRFSYAAASFGRQGTFDETTGIAKFNAFAPAMSTGMFDVVAPNGTATETVTVDPTEFALTPPLGVMVVSHDNTSATEARLITIPPLS